MHQLEQTSGESEITASFQVGKLEILRKGLMMIVVATVLACGWVLIMARPVV